MDFSCGHSIVRFSEEIGGLLAQWGVSAESKRELMNQVLHLERLRFFERKYGEFSEGSRIRNVLNLD